MKHIINLDNGTKLEITGTEVKHIDVDGSILYDTVRVKDVPGLPYFFFMGKMERTKVKEWFNSVNSIVDKKEISKRNFITRVESALKVIDYDYCIATIEPSMKARKLYYEPGNEVATGLSAEQWETKAKNYAPHLGSRLALPDELILWYAYRIAKGYWSLRYVCQDSSAHGNYNDSPTRKAAKGHTVEKDLTGVKEVGGFKDGVGNTYKIVKNAVGTFWNFGGAYVNAGWRYPVASGEPIWASRVRDRASGVVVLTKVD